MSKKFRFQEKTQCYSNKVTNITIVNTVRTVFERLIYLQHRGIRKDTVPADSENKSDLQDNAGRSEGRNTPPKEKQPRDFIVRKLGFSSSFFRNRCTFKTKPVKVVVNNIRHI